MRPERSLRRCLRWSTVLGTGLLLGVQPARAQDVPPLASQAPLPQRTDGTIRPDMGTGTIARTPTTLDVTVSSRSLVIDWTNFSIPTGSDRIKFCHIEFRTII